MCVFGCSLVVCVFIYFLFFFGGGGMVTDLYIEMLCIRLVFLSLGCADIRDVVTSVSSSPLSSVHNAAVTKMSNDLKNSMATYFPPLLVPLFSPSSCPS